LIIKPGSDLSADRILTITTGNAARTFTLGSDFSITASGALTATDTGVVMIGDGGTTKAYFYQNTAPTGWTVDATPADAVLAVKGGAQAYNANGGQLIGTWTQLDHLHTTGDFSLETAHLAAHTHGSPHTNSGGSTFNGLNAGISAIDAYSTTTGSTGSGTAHNHGNSGNSAPANTWRPYASLGIICTLDA